NFGAPLTQTRGTAIWNGTFGAIGGASNVNVVADKDFELEVTFGNTPNAAGSVEAFVKTDADPRGINPHYHLKGTYDSRGVISGTVDFGGFDAGGGRMQTTPRDPNGTLSGLIGQEGAVGVFISHANGDTGYAGGFIAGPE
ncbi:MAG: hypothetical protein K8953_04730, partial [Proteobacteria bacterium]|nr:hypothetical protein [Pseudomonadota bacterium]